MARTSVMHTEATAMLIAELEARDWPAAELRDLVARTLGCSPRTVARAFHSLPDADYETRQPGDRSAMLWCRRR